MFDAIVRPNRSRISVEWKQWRLPSYIRWLWDGEFCGSIGFRWQPGTSLLPAHCLGHIGFTVVPWKRRRGYGTEGLRLLLPEARAEGLAYVERTTDVGNVASRRIIEANGGVLVERFAKPGNSETIGKPYAIGSRCRQTIGDDVRPKFIRLLPKSCS